MAIAITSTMLIRIKYCKNIHPENAVFNKRILNKVGYKIQDLELKINVLTYKMQYGTWPLPHQICNLNPKLRKIRMTLSNPGDRKNWLKHVLLNPSSESNVYAPYSNVFHSSKTKLLNRFDIKQERVPQHIKHSKLSTACSSIESLKSTSDQSVNIYAWRPSIYSQNVNMKKNDLSKSKDFTLQRRNVQLLPLDSNRINHRSSRIITPLTQNACATNVKHNPCQKFTDTVYKCKSFLKELQYNDKRLRSLNRSSEISKVSSLKTHARERTALSTMEKRETSYGAPVEKREEINGTKCVERIKDNVVKDTEEMYCSSKMNTSDNAVVSKTNSCASSRELIPVVPIMRSTYNAQTSQETLHEVRQRLQSLHNVLQTYEDTSQSLERQNSADQLDKTDSFITYPIVDISSEYFDLNRSEESFSSFAEYSSHTSHTKTYQRSSENVTLRNTYSKGFSRHNRQKSVKSNHSTSEDYENEGCAKEQNTLDRNRNHELESNREANKDATKTNTLLFNTRDSISERIFYILSPENKNIQTEALLEKSLPAEKFSNAFAKEQREENVTISQNSSQSKMSNRREVKSTAFLLQEALHFKNALLTQSKKKYPMNDVKEDDIADVSPLVSNDNFPSMIVDIKEEAPIISNSRDKINQRYICLEMKQRCDVFPRSLKKVNTFTHHEDEQDTKSQDSPETSSEYFSITDLAVHNNAEIENNVTLTPPVYEKVISITIPVNIKSQNEVNINKKSMQTQAVLPNIQSQVNLRENSRENTASDIINKRSPTMLKLEDLILERVKDIRDYMDTFLQSQNIAIFKARRALQCQGKNDTFRSSDEASHVVIYNRSTTPSRCNSTDQIISSKKSSDFLTHTWANYTQEYNQETDDVLKCSSDVYLKRNPGMFALITPIKNKFSNKNDTQQLEVPTELKREEVDMSLPPPLTYHKNDFTHEIKNFNTPRCEEHISNIKNDEIDKKTIVDVNMDKRTKQTQITESKPSTISYFPIDVANVDTKVIHVAREEHLTKSNCNSISHSNSYFTDEEMINDIKMDNVSSKSTSNMKHFHAKSNVQKEKKQNVIKQQISVNECLDANTSKLSSDNEYSDNLTIIIDSNLILDKSGHNYSRNAKRASPLTILKENDFIFDPSASSLPFSLDKESKILNATSTSLNNLKHNERKNDEISIAKFSPQIEHYLTKPLQTYAQIKAKSDISLISNRNKDLKVNLYPKKSHSYLLRHNAMEYISGTLHQPCAKLHSDKNKCIKNKRYATQSKSIILPRKVSTKSYIPILKNRLESTHRMKRQAQARSPRRSPLTMLWGEKTCTRDHTTDEEIALNDNVSMNKHLRVVTTSNSTKLNTEKNTLDKKLEKSENVTYRDSDAPKESSELLATIQNVESLTIDKHSDKRDTYGNKSDTSITRHIEKIASKEVVIISIMANDNLRKKYPADLFILNTKNISPATDLLIHKNKIWTITVEKTEKEVMAKPSITDTCTSMSALQKN